ncbi:hypothetical protein GCM10027046_10510 [Uliginosibacterium flavum]
MEEAPSKGFACHSLVVCKAASGLPARAGWLEMAAVLALAGWLPVQARCVRLCGQGCERLVVTLLCGSDRLSV